MHRKSHYTTVSKALEDLSEKGFDKNLYIKNSKVYCDSEELKSEDLQIVEVYRYEGATNPADEAIVNTVKSKTGIKGAIVDGYGLSADNESADVIKRIPMKTES
jgi:hypothetical protein